MLIITSDCNQTPPELLVDTGVYMNIRLLPQTAWCQGGSDPSNGQERWSQTSWCQNVPSFVGSNPPMSPLRESPAKKQAGIIEQNPFFINT